MKRLIAILLLLAGSTAYADCPGACCGGQGCIIAQEPVKYLLDQAKGEDQTLVTYDGPTSSAPRIGGIGGLSGDWDRCWGNYGSQGITIRYFQDRQRTVTVWSYSVPKSDGSENMIYDPLTGWQLKPANK
jgi:hypothetical protein